MHINPVLAPSNDIDKDLSQAIYDGLFRYNEKGKVEKNLVENYEISDNNTKHVFHLKKGVLWHDGEELTAQDVIFTLNLITDPAYKSPLRSNWQEVEIELIDNYSFSLKTKEPYIGFLSNLTFGILPKHIWETVTSEKFSLTDLNLEPIGTGPYKYADFQKDSNGNILTYKLVANPNYFKGKPYISKISFNFYSSEEEAIDAYNRKEVIGISGVSPQKLTNIKSPQSTEIHSFTLPRYFAVFLNQNKSLPLAYDEVREALSYATNREGMINEILGGWGKKAFFPILPGMTGYSDDIDKREFDLEKAKKILEDKGWEAGDDGIRSKDGTVLEFTLITTEWEELVKTAQMVKDQWSQVGARVNVEILSISDIQQNYIRPREYESLLFGQVLGSEPDLYSFWHSEQKKDPGLNLSLFGGEETDTLIEEGRIEFNEEKRAEIYKEFQEKLNKEVPAVFLYQPDYIYPVNKKVKGIDMENLISPSTRFSQINDWYIRTKRVWK